ncbi:MAG: flotillin family protein, partial [bacterium]
MSGIIGLVIFGAIVIFGVFVFFASIYKRCPSDKILVKFGSVGTDTEGKGLSAKCVHGGGEMVFPVIQDYGWLDLTPLTIDIDLTDALSAQNIRVSTPSTYTVGVSTEPGIMENAAERLLGESLDDIRNLARDIIFGQMRVVIATMKIEKINADRDQFIQNISKSLEPELEKVGLRLINVNIKDVNDKSGYIDALGREAAAQAINEAKKKVAQQERDGEIGKAEAEKEQRIQVAEADASAVEGENKSEVKIAESDSQRRQKEAEAERKATAAEKVSEAKAQQEAYQAQKETEQARAEREEAAQRADTVVPAKIEKERIETLAEAEAEEERRRKQGEADGIRSVMEARAEGILANLNSKGKGFKNIVESCNNNPELASLLMVTEQLPDLVSEQVKAISDIEFDSVTVWENGGGDGKTSTANFLSGLVESLPPLHEVTKNAGIDLPDYLGQVADNAGGIETNGNGGVAAGVA